MNGIFFYRSAVRFVIILLAALSLSGVDLSPDYRKIEPLALSTDDPPVVAAQRKMMEAPGRPDLPVPVFIHMKSDDPDLPERLTNLGGSGNRITSRLFTARIPRDAARYISNWPQVAYIESAKRARPLLDLSRPAVSADIVQAGTGLPTPFTGAGMYVGSVDTGLSGAHLDFQTGGASRVAHTYASPGLPSLGVSSNPLVDEDGHGTHVMGIAAGNGFSSGGTYTGMAPGAEILFGKTSFTTTDIIIAVQNLISFAEANSRPIPVNLSVGIAVGPHDGSSGFESGINSLAAGTAGSRRLIAVAAGNETGDNEHCQATLDPFGTSSIPITLEGPTSPGVSNWVDIWADGADQFTVTATMGSEVVSIPSGSVGSSPQGRITIHNRNSIPPNGATYIQVFFLPLVGGGLATIQLDRTRNGGTGKIDAYIDLNYGTFNAATNSGTITEPANGSAVVAVGSFNTKSPPPPPSGSPTTQDISSFSSRGPTRDGRLKPDITAPGAFLFSTRSFEAPSSNYFGIVDNNYAILAGTSMSTPHVTGIAALVWQSNPDLTGAQMRERIKRTANPPTDGSIPPNTTWGYGKVNALRAVDRAVAGITVVPPQGVSAAAIPPGTPVTLLGDEKSSGPFGQVLSYSWSASAGGSLGTPTAAQTSFVALSPGDYPVTLTVTPGTAPYNSATATLHVNNVPSVTSIAGPASTDNAVPVSFQGAGTDPDGQTLAFRWVLVSRPAGSTATLTTANLDNVTLTPDVGGSYVVGLRVDDGLDTSALFTRAFTLGAVPQIVLPSSGGGGGGGCGLATDRNEPGGVRPLVTVVILFFPAGALAARRYARSRKVLRREGKEPSLHF